MSAVAGRRPIHIGGLTDDDLVRLARDGDEQAFDTIVHRYRAPLVAYCRRWLDPHRAEEVVQHTFMKAFLCVRDDDRPLVLRPWLYRVAHNAALNALEKKGSDWEELDENYDGVPQPPQVAEQRARFLKVVDEIDALPDRQREALLLNEFEGRCYADIASQLGTSESGVRGLLRRARTQLRTAAAALFPLPALRELVRTDPARTLQLERAGDMIGTAGAAGGIGTGIAKVAAGVLAAGTIAGGGAAIQAKRDSHPVPRPDSVQDAASRSDLAAAERVRSTVLADVVRADADAHARQATGTRRARPIAAVQLPSMGPHGGASPGGAPGTTTPSAPEGIAPLGTLPTLPPLPSVPLVPLEGASEEEPVTEEPGAGESEQQEASAPPPDEGQQADADEPEGTAAPSEDRTTRSDQP